MRRRRDLRGPIVRCAGVTASALGTVGLFGTRREAVIAAGLLVGGLVLAGRPPVPSWGFRTAAAQLLAGLTATAGLAGLVIRQTPAAAAALLVAGVALATLDITGRRLGPADLLAPAAGLLGAVAGRPAPIAAGLAVLAGGALLARLRPAAEQRLSDASVLAAMAEAVVVLDADGRVARANPRWYELVRRPAAEVVGQHPPQLDVPVLTTHAPLPEPGWSVATYLDVTDQRKTEEALAEQVASLEHTNEQLQATTTRLERAATFKNDLMALVSHEMSQPLSSSASLAELLADSWEQLPEETRLDLTVKIHRNTRRLVGMVNDMLLLFHLDSGTVTARRTPVPVAEVVDVVAAGLPAGAEINTRIDPAADALVDRNHLEQIIGNLLSNSVAYGEPPIEVTARPDGDGVLITVSDHGAGIPEEIQRHLFERAVRPKATGTGSGRGRGLGLFIARHLTEVNGGRIWYEPAVPHGARLVIRLESTARD